METILIEILIVTLGVTLGLILTTIINLTAIKLIEFAKRYHIGRMVTFSNKYGVQKGWLWEIKDKGIYKKIL